MTISVILLVVALIFFILAAIGVASKANLTAVGLAFVTLAQLLGRVVFVLAFITVTGCSSLTPEQRAGWNSMGQQAAGAVIGLGLDWLKDQKEQQKLPSTKGFSK